MREHLAALGFRSIEEAVGHVELLDTTAAVEHWKAAGLDVSPILHSPDVEGRRRRTRGQDHGLDKALDQTLDPAGRGRAERWQPVRLELPIRNVNRTVGTMLGHEVTKRYADAGLPDDTIDVTFTGSAGQSFGAFVPKGITLRLLGDANDYLGKGLSGGRIVVRPNAAAPFRAEDNVIAGNVILYGATAGEAYIRGIVGERFAVRNSGATAVVEGVGDHACEYMTGGRVVVLGATGRNVAAGMSGGIAYFLDLDPAGSTARWSTSSRSDADDRGLAAHADRPPRRGDRLNSRGRAARGLGAHAVGGSPRSCRGTTSGCSRRRRRPRTRAWTLTRRSWRRPMADPRAS